MKKKNHTLRNFIIYTIFSVVLLWGLILVGTVLFGKFNEGGNAVVPNSVGIFNDFGTTYLGALKVVLNGELWSFEHVWTSTIWYVIVVLTGLSFVISFIIALVKKQGKYVFASILNLIFCLALGYAYLGIVYSQYFNEMAIAPYTLVAQFKKLLMFKSKDFHFGWSIYCWGYVLATLLSVIGITGIFFTIVCRLYKKQETTEEVKVVEPTKVEETPVPAVETVPEKKKPVLIIKRYDKYGKTGPVIESKVNNYPEEPIVSKPLTQEEIRNVIRDEFERQEALRLAEAYKQEKNAQMIAEAIVKATNANNGANVKPQAEETVACTCKEPVCEEEKKVYPSPIVFAMPSSARDEFYPKEVKEKKPLPAKKEEKSRLTEQEMRDIIADEISKALKDFVITKETIVEKPVEIKIESEPKNEETTQVEEPVVQETLKVTPEEVKLEEQATTTEVIDETVTPESVVVETVVDEAPAATEAVATQEVKEEPIAETAPVNEVIEEVKEEPKVEETIVEEPVKEELKVEEALVEESTVEKKPAEEPKVVEKTAPAVDPNIPLTSNGTPKIIRIPFTTRMMEADGGLKDCYNELKSLLKSYGLNNRVSNSGDAFRLHRVTYCKITVAGKSLKLYLALNPADYADTTYPVKDASSKAIYKETPLVFKVKSGLSLRRGEELIRDCMDKHGLEQIDQVQLKDWASDLANIEIEDDGQDSDDEE